MTELLDCPFCGGNGFSMQNHARTVWQTSCTECHAGTPSRYQTKEMAETAWNTRQAASQGTDERVCTACEQSKPLAEFGLWLKRGKRTYYAKCRSCKNAQNRDPAKREDRKEYRRARRMSPKGDMMRKSDLSHFRRRQEKYPEQQTAKRMVRRAIEKGQLIRPGSCERCGDSPPPITGGRPSIQAHHSDYSKPLVVQWLCIDCHSKEHNS